MSRLSFVGKFADTAVTQRMKLSIIILRALAGLALELAHRPLRPRSLGDTFQSPSLPANPHHDCQQSTSARRCNPSRVALLLQAVVQASSLRNQDWQPLPSFEALA